MERSDCTLPLHRATMANEKSIAIAMALENDTPSTRTQRGYQTSDNANIQPTSLEGHV
jgi:hypothetical protein